MHANNIGGYEYRKDIYNPVDKYINHIKVALYSLSKHCDLPVTVYLIECDQKIGRDLKRLYENLRVQHITPTAQGEKVKRVRKNNPLRFIMTREKPLIIKSALADNNNDWILYIDCDSIIRYSIINLVSKINDWGADTIGRTYKESRFVILNRPNAEMEKHKINAGVIGLTNTPQTRALVDLWYEEALKIDDISCEQHGLYIAYCKMKRDIKMIPLESQYNCWNWNEDPIIYHSKAKYFNYLPFKSLFFPLLWEAQQIIGG